MKTGYTALFYKYEGWWLARVAEVPGVNTQGKTLKEARANLKDALLGILEVNPRVGGKGSRATRSQGENAGRARLMKRRELMRHLSRHGYYVARGERGPVPGLVQGTVLQAISAFGV